LALSKIGWGWASDHFWIFLDFTIEHVDPTHETWQINTTHAEHDCENTLSIQVIQAVRTILVDWRWSSEEGMAKKANWTPQTPN